MDMVYMMPKSISQNLNCDFKSDVSVLLRRQKKGNDKILVANITIYINTYYTV